jgi:hypothetical protein
VRPAIERRIGDQVVDGLVAKRGQAGDTVTELEIDGDSGGHLYGLSNVTRIWLIPTAEPPAPLRCTRA